MAKLWKAVEVVEADRSVALNDDCPTPRNKAMYLTLAGETKLRLSAARSGAQARRREIRRGGGEPGETRRRRTAARAARGLLYSWLAQIEAT